MDLPNKLVAVLNKGLDFGTALNALSHISLSMGARLGKDKAELVDYISKDETCYPCISKMPFIITKGSGNKIRLLMEEAEEKQITWSVFTDTMTIGSWDEQVKRTALTLDKDLIFYGIVLFGPKELVSSMTKKFSLWR